MRILIVATLVVAVTVLSCDRGSSIEEIRAEGRSPLESQAGGSAPVEGDHEISPREQEPKHGGVVRTVDIYHVEVAPDPLQIWLYDRRGEQLPMSDVDGRIVIYAGGERHPYELEVEQERLSPVQPVTLPDEGSAFVELTIGKKAIDVAFDLPLA